jgi:hypothetical protein
MSANPTEAMNSLASRLGLRDDGERFTLRIDVQAATVRYVDGVFEVSLAWRPKEEAPCKPTACDSTRTKRA